MRKLLVLAIAAVTGLLVAASPAAAHSKSHHSDSGSKCDGTFVGKTFNRDIFVPKNGACTLIDSRVRGRVKALENSYFQAQNTKIRKSVEGEEAQTLFIDTGTRVKGDISADATNQVFVFRAKVTGDIDVQEATGQVFICGNTVTEGNILVQDSSRDILVGDTLAEDCPGNVVRLGSVRVEDNFTDVELVIRGNTIRVGDLLVSENFGSSDKHVDTNVGGGTLNCVENDPLFSGAPNANWASKQGQCAGP